MSRSVDRPAALAIFYRATIIFSTAGRGGIDRE
jgi:hypothetical protein